MKSFTTCASVANKFFKVLQGYTKGIRFVAVLTMLLIVGIGQAWAETKTYSYTFSAKQFSANGSKTLSNVSWTLAGDGGYWGYDATKGQQFGSGGDPYKTLTLSTSGISGTITKIIINTSGASSVNASFTVSVGGTQWGSSTKLTTTATAYTFTGSNSGEIKFSYTQTSSKALYIKSISVTYETAASYTVTYNANGGSGTMSNSTGSSIKIKECTFTAPGCKQFTSWNTAANGSGTSYAPNATVATNLTLYAQWGDLPSYTVKLMDNNEVLTFSCNTPITLPSRVDCDGYGYTFVGWTKTWTEEQEEWTTTAPAIIPAGSYTPTANVNLYPVYTKTETTPGATTTTTDYVLTDLANIKSTDVVVITSKNSSDSYYAMSNNNGTGSAPTATSVTVSNNKLSSTPNDDLKWNISNNSGTLTIYKNGSTSNWLYCTSTNNGVRVGTNTNKTFTIDSSTGYLKHTGTSRYLGVYNNQDWRCYTSVNDNIKNQTLAFFVETTTTTTTSTTTTSYISVPDCTTETAITLNPNGGTISANGWTYENGVYKLTTEDESITLPEITRAGYTFDGWATSAGGGKVYNYKATINLDGTAVNLYAIWTPIIYTITYELDGGTNHASNPANYTIETEAITLQDPNKTNHNFVGWYKESTFATQVTQIAKGSTGNITLYAKWEEIPTTCTVTYDANGGTGTVTDDTEYTNGASVTVKGNYGKLTKDGYAFTGWNTESDGSGTPYNAGDEFVITTNTTLYAQWCEAHWVLVTNTSEIEDDTRIIIAAKDYNAALSTNQKTDNRGQATITKKYNTVIFGEDVQKLSLEVGISKNTFALNTGLGYLYAASSSANQLKTRENYGNEGSWEISFDGVVARVAALGNTHNTLSYNKTSELFSCYLYEKRQKDVVIYKEVCKQDSYEITENLSNATAANTNAETVLASATSLSLKYSAADGYLLPETITVKMGGVALSSTDDYTWNKETGDLTISVTGFYGDVDVVIEAEVDPCYTFTMSDVEATSTTNSITLTWTEVAGATGYKVRLDEGEFTTATGLTHTFEGLSPKTTYNWEVQAVSAICEDSKTGSTDTQKETFTVSWSVNGNVTSTESVVDGESIQDTPSTPSDQALEDCGANKFMGWSEKSAGSTPQDAAYYDDLCSAEDMIAKYPSITSNKTFYAVFATGEETTGGTVEASLSFASTAQRDSQTSSKQVWSNEGITFTNNKGSSTTDVANYSNPVRLYKNSEIIVEHTSGEITKIVFDCNSSAYATALKNSIGTPNSNTTVTVSSDKVTVTFANAVASFSAKLTSDQVRLDALTVTAGGGTITTYSNYVTNCCATPVPTNGSYTSPSGTSVTLTWDGESTQYHITGEGLDDYSKEESYTITGLTECDEYTFYVSAYPEDGCESEAIAITAQPFSGAKTVTINYNGNGQAKTTSSTSCGNTSITLPTPTWAGYRFMGWYTAANGGDKVNENPYTPTSDITLYAHWEKEYTVTYNANGGSTTCAGGAYIAGETVTVCTTNPSKTGHTFTGWTYSPNVTITDGKFVMPASDVTITAQWQVNSYTVTWNPNGGNWGGSTASIVETYEYGATIVQPAAPQRDGYRFTGWNYSIPATMPAGNATYTAQWKQNYTITFYDGDDVTPWTQTKDAESINLTEYVGTLACDDYQFAGWSTADTKYNDETANITTWVTGNYTPTANIDLYAVYSKGAVTNDFTLNCAGGVYEIWVNNSAKNHMAGQRNDSYNLFTKEYWDSNKTGSNGAPFTITRIAENTYTIQNAEGHYIAKHSNDTKLDIESEWQNLDRYKWTVSAGTNGSWRFTNKAVTTHALIYYNNYFRLYTATSVTNGSTSYYDLELTPAASNVYQSNPNCGPYYIIFNTHGGEFIQGEYAYGDEQTGLTETTYSKFPAAELEGYTFAGWKDGSPIDDEITADNASDAPYLKQAGEDLVVSSNKTYHAVYYYYDEEEDIDFSKEFTTSIYAEVNGMKYFLAGTPSSGTMSSTTDCGYVSEVTITPGTGANAGKYKITVNGVAMAPKANETDLLNGTYWWTITERSVGSGEYKISGQDKKNIVLFSSSWGHYTYNQGSEYGNNYYYPRFGKCIQHHWTSNPTLKPSLNLSGDVYVTATNARGIMATSTLKVYAKQLNANEKVNITSNSNDVYFSADCTVNFVKANKPTNTLTITASPSGVIEQDIYVHYKPSAEGNGTPASVVVSANLATPNPSVTDDQTVYVRNMPAKFVIATKVGATWYALPADMSSATNPLGVVIEVDETTMTTIAPNTTTYTLWPVKTTATENDRYTNVTGAAYGDRVRFAAVNYEQRGLWANNNNNGSTIRNFAIIDALGDDGLAGYEWKITTTVVDGHWQYTLQTDQDKNQNFLRYWTSAEGTPVGPKWGTYNAGENKLYFLPITETQPFEYAVVEWYPTKVLIQTDAAITSPTVKVDGEAVASPILTNKGGKLYEISNLPLETNPNKLLQISFTDNAINYTNTKVVPIILSRGAKTITGEPFATLTQKVYQYADVVVRDGATLSIDGTTDVANTLLGVTIYPTAKVSVADGYKLSVHNLTFFGGIDEIYNGSTYEINKYGVPQLSLKGILSKTVTTIDYIMRVDLDQMYSLTVPYDVQLADIKYWDGSDIALGSALYVSAYDGEARANQSKKTWIYETDFESRLGAATLKAGVGYTISAELQAGVGNEYSILRMPMMSNVASGATEAAKTVAVTAWGKDANVTDNHKGWNLVGNPFMSSITGADDTDLVLGYLKETGTGPWEWVEQTYRYVTIPADNGKDYSQQKFTEAVLPPFKNFFVQIGTTGELAFGLGTRQSMPARSTQAAIEKEVEFEILMSNDARQDNTGLLISEEYSPAYEINADLEKMIGSMSVYTIYGGYKLAYNALSPINASEWIPMGYIAPTAGEYTFRIDDVDKVIDQIAHIYLIDYTTNTVTDLMVDEYQFATLVGTNDTRFAINVILNSRDNTTTGLGNIKGYDDQPIKFIYQDKMYIHNNGIIYDATGKQVTTINK